MKSRHDDLLRAGGAKREITTDAASAVDKVKNSLPWRTTPLKTTLNGSSLRGKGRRRYSAEVAVAIRQMSSMRAATG